MVFLSFELQNAILGIPKIHSVSRRIFIFILIILLYALSGEQYYVIIFSCVDHEIGNKMCQNVDKTW